MIFNPTAENALSAKDDWRSSFGKEFVRVSRKVVDVPWNVAQLSDFL
jgi:hypothetical protein